MTCGARVKMCYVEVELPEGRWLAGWAVVVLDWATLGVLLLPLFYFFKQE